MGDFGLSENVACAVRSKAHEVEPDVSPLWCVWLAWRSKGLPAHSPSSPLARRASPEALLGERQLPPSDVYRSRLCCGSASRADCRSSPARRGASRSGAIRRRPAVSAICWSEGLEEKDAKTSLRSLMEAGWSRDAAARPPMLRFVEVLESVEGGRVITAPVEQEDASALLGGVPRQRRAYEISFDEVQLGKELARGAYGAGKRTRLGRRCSLAAGAHAAASHARPASRRVASRAVHIGHWARRRWP